MTWFWNNTTVQRPPGDWSVFRRVHGVFTAKRGAKTRTCPFSGHTAHRATIFLLLAVLLIALVGCGKSDRIDGRYGRRRGARGGNSPNGTGVLAGMFEKAGYRVNTWTRLSPGIKYYDVIVWTPDDFQVPTKQQRDFLERWLAEEESRTLIYIGRDHDATITYWQKVQPGAPAGQATEIKRRLANARSNFTTARSGIPAKKYCKWFTVHRAGPRRDVRTLAGPWSEGIDATKVEIELVGRFDTPKVEDMDEPPEETSEPDLPDTSPLLEEEPAEETPDDYGDEPSSEEGNEEWEEDTSEKDPWEEDTWDEDEWEDDWGFQLGIQEIPEVPPDDIEVLLESEGDVLVSRLSDYHFKGSNVIVVTNGSFLLNVPLVNHEHRKLAGKLVEACGEPGKVAFLESGLGGPTVYDDEPGTKYPSLLDPFRVWPIGCILMHLAVVGILYCLARFPIFGRSYELQDEGVSDFGRHINALGNLLRLTADHRYASDKLHHYLQTVKGDTGSESKAVSKPEIKTKESTEIKTKESTDQKREDL